MITTIVTRYWLPWWKVAKEIVKNKWNKWSANPQGYLHLESKLVEFFYEKGKAAAIDETWLKVSYFGLTVS